MGPPRKLIASLAFAAVFSAPTIGPDGRGEETTPSPIYKGVTANAPIPAELHLLNEGGSDGAGLCVIASIVCNGRWQGVPGLAGGKESELWRAAKSSPGGYYPGKLEALLKRLLPDEEWISWEGDGTDLLEAYSAKGYPVGATMSTGALYGYVPIHHMISLIHLDGTLACVVDNNDPGKYHWMPASEYAKRFKDGPKGWGFIWLRKKSSLGHGMPHAALIGLSVTFLAIGHRRRKFAAESS